MIAFSLWLVATVPVTQIPEKFNVIQVGSNDSDTLQIFYTSRNADPDVSLLFWTVFSMIWLMPDFWTLVPDRTCQKNMWVEPRHWCLIMSMLCQCAVNHAYSMSSVVADVQSRHPTLTLMNLRGTGFVNPEVETCSGVVSQGSGSKTSWVKITRNFWPDEANFFYCSWFASIISSPPSPPLAMVRN